MLTESENLVFNFRYDPRLVFQLSMLQHVLDNVVAILISEQPVCCFMQLNKDWGGLQRRAVLQDALDDTTSIWVS